MISSKKEINHLLFSSTDEAVMHVTAQSEYAFYSAIASGNVEALKKSQEAWVKSKGYTEGNEKHGILSKDPLQNRKFHFVTMTAMIVRFCIEAGLNRETGYNLSDKYCQECDTCTTIEQINELTEYVINSFFDLMTSIRKRTIYSKQISKCVDYIYNHLNQNLQVATLAKQLKMTPSYLSRLFSKELGVPISAYIKNLRLETAAQMLLYSDYEIADISNYFQFSSQSHFTSSFQAKYGITPKRYRDEGPQ